MKRKSSYGEDDNVYKDEVNIISSSPYKSFPFITAMVIVPNISPSFFHLRLRIPAATSPASYRLKHGDGGGGIALSTIRAYIEKPNSISSFANTVIGSLPVIGLLARILSDEGGVGRDLVDFAEFRRSLRQRGSSKRRRLE